jgi:diguanylate cyclase (GGDEF)-like protein/PAS domain S-box-containing protein
MNFYNAILLLLLLFPYSAFGADTLYINDTQNSINPSKNILVYEDKTHTQNIQTIKKLDPQNWSHLPDNIANFGFSDSAYWFNFKIKNNGSSPLELYLNLDYPLIDSVSFFVFNNDKLEIKHSTGDKYKFDQRPVKHPTFLLPFEIGQSQTKEIFLRVETTGSLQVPLTIWQKDAFLIESQSSHFLYGSFLSALLIMCAYNLCLFVLIRDPSYILYSLFIIMVMGVHASLDGFAYQWLWPEQEAWHQISALTFISFGLITTVFFTKNLLPIPRKSPIRFGVSFLLCFSIGSAILTGLMSYRYAAMLNGLTTIIVMGGVSIICIAMLKHSPRVARFYTFAWSAYFLGIVLKSASKMGYLPYSPLTEYAGNIGAIIGVILISLALAERINSERRAKEFAQIESIENLQRFHELYENAMEAIFSFDLNGKLLSGNPEFLKLVGISDLSTFKGSYSNPDGFTIPADEFLQLIETVKSKGKLIGHEIQLNNDKGIIRWASISGRLNKGYTNREPVIEFTLIDINERKVFEQQLQHLASHDSLTGFFNRRAFESKAKEKLEDVKSYQDNCCLMYMDLDQFKIVNDLCGHTAGDALLKNLSQRLLNQVNNLKGDQVIARLGGDEFGILLSNTTLQQGQVIAEEFRQSIESFLFMWEGSRYSLGVSIGLVEICPFHHSVEQLLVMADTACYKAKDLGRNRVHTFIETDKDLQFRQLEMQWVSTIKEALSQDHFFLVFQLITPNNEQNHEFHYEILLRLLSSNGNLCAPNQFLPAAERYNLMTNIDQWVINHYFTWLNNNPDHLNQLVSASINLSTQSLGDEAFSVFLINAFNKHSIPHEKICFEITESMAITNLDNTQIFIKKFRSLGCRFALDDFGTGFSSYAYLKELKVDYLKIDGIFVRNITEDDVDYAMVKSISDVAKAIGIETIAEFVENEEIRQELINIGITYSQGYHIHKPTRLEPEAFLTTDSSIFQP